ncbi:MAG: hypothetical protein JKY28_05370 [Sulfurimonas sp.]|nr:hypothetical protein [Sulfurimonas sp.]PHQ90116.1 MAG: hypothetical protein COB42_05735 [Sulfurimonas sp.]
MKINWKIDYNNNTATCGFLTVKITEVKEPQVQVINDTEVSIGFTKIDSKKMYQCHITYISEELWKQNLEDNKLLPNFASQLGDTFNEKYFSKNGQNAKS